MRVNRVQQIKGLIALLDALGRDQAPPPRPPLGVAASGAEIAATFNSAAKSAQEFTDLFRAKYGTPPDAYAAIAYIAYMEMFRGFEAAKSLDAKKVSEALMGGTQNKWVKEQVMEVEAPELVKTLKRGIEPLLSSREGEETAGEEAQAESRGKRGE